MATQAPKDRDRVQLILCPLYFFLLSYALALVMTILGPGLPPMVPHYISGTLGSIVSRLLLGAPLFIVGILMNRLSRHAFNESKTPYRPGERMKFLVKGGVYGYVRLPADWLAHL